MGRHSEFQQKIWNAARSLPVEGRAFFSVRDVVERAGVKYQVVNRYFRALARSGMLMVCGRCGRRNTYSFERDFGVEAPRICANGCESLDGRVYEQLWRTVRILKFFSARELAITASTEERFVSYDAARKYVRCLYNAGYLRLVERGRCGRQGRYALCRQMNTGPKAPQIHKGGVVYDANLCRVMGAAL
jgi:predicted transcriptional regulator